MARRSMHRVVRKLEGGRLNGIAVVILVVSLILSAVPGGASSPAALIARQDGGSETGDAASPAAALSPDDLSLLAAVAGMVVTGQAPDVSALPVTERLSQGFGPVFVVLRAGGARVGSDWADGDTTLGAIITAVGVARESGDAALLPGVDAVEVCLSHSYREIDLNGADRELLTEVHMGVLGIELTHVGETSRYSPTLMLANNWDFTDVLERFANARNLSPESLLGPDVSARIFGCDQALVLLGDQPRAVRMERGNTLVTMEEVTEERIARLGDALGGWLTRQVHDDGRMTYKYWPSSRQESSADNVLRQWMATVALNRLAASRGGDPAIYELAARNIRYNLDRYYEQEGELGLVVDYDGDVKLGAIALAALALIEHPLRAEFAREEAALRRTIDALWQADGSFRTFYRPADRNDNQNFYPGEALLLEAVLYTEHPDPVLLDRFMTSFRYYRDWHRANPNPAFVPWHTQAYALVWRQTGDPELLAFIFEMNDWLLGVQQWDTAEYPDLQGQFYDPLRPEFGPSHASSTGVYLEGLIEAYRLAVEAGESERADQYRLAIRRGLRSVLQLEFADAVDLYYIQDPDYVLGGLRTTVSNNEIRVDNIQHNLLAVLEILDTFSADDFTRSEPGS